MRADGVVDSFPVAEFAIEFSHFQGAGGDRIELLGVGAVGAFDAVEFGRTGRQHEPMQSALRTGLFEVGGGWRRRRGQWCALPALLDRTDHSAVAYDKTSAG